MGKRSGQKRWRKIHNQALAAINMDVFMRDGSHEAPELLFVDLDATKISEPFPDLPVGPGVAQCTLSFVKKRN